MLSKRFLIISIILLFLALIVLVIFYILDTTSNTPSNATPANAVIDYDYFAELTEFTVRITDDPDNVAPLNVAHPPFPSPVYAKYVRQETVIDMRESNYPHTIVEKTAYIFETTSTNATVYVLMPTGVADNIDLIPGNVYTIEYETNYGWPNAFCLIIYEDDSVIFAGLSDRLHEIDFNIYGYIPVKVKEFLVMEENYLDAGSCNISWIKKYNVEITFNLGEESVVLHQGQSAVIGDYEITLLIARDIEYTPGWYDVGQNNLSYVISKTN